MIFYYENSNGEKLDLMKPPYRAIEADIYDSVWESNSDGYEKKIELDMMDDTTNYAENMNRLYDIFAVDPENDAYGKLWVNGSYIYCRVKKKETNQWKGQIYAYITLTFVAPDLAWITEEKKTFVLLSESDGMDGLDYPYDYPYDYTAGKDATASWIIDNISDSDFSMIIYGPCVNPEIDISGHTYAVDTTVDSEEYLIIDSQSHTIMKHVASGSNISLFDKRNTEQSVFQKIKGGINTIRWSGSFLFDVIVYKARREPKWN
ncbi:hypothetical protein [Jingyaoa shaoxingensis]|uniref:Phage tail protein n=1 Tax=Jingyaoa shaoxingensis TaxID=2763671 RepID=A0ABR7NFK4_9FIRM|nr:hypothetical protein [Jingyaoa shaoxingensis]MBC8574438.1 hypothetical protein [Jingyaoa shaoxingensis]